MAQAISGSIYDNPYCLSRVQNARAAVQGGNASHVGKPEGMTQAAVLK